MRIALVLSLPLGLAASAHAQRLVPALYEPVSSARPSYILSSNDIPRTYWLEGGVIGGVTFGIFGVMMMHGLSDSTPSVAADAGAFLIGATVGFPLGALIGGQFRKGGSES